ncbi:hypothetical protein T472_0206470 [Youngiibacter fragilis 232.1]|uniref:DZANK-type domain-containing protein n=1 Tax=Youngiibacter fragilis 232.1 TaxID=994573 RepID=V7I5C5_9CLOT|nr:hypothetical protein T472_0206470 [Youngiibacter fragilis 232.1]
MAPIASMLFLVIPIMIGIYVYRDASQRGMNAVLWTLISVFSPTFIGLIIYLIVRNDHSAMQCPKCQYPVTEQYSVCPHCGTQLKERCQKCSSPLESYWEVCATCGEPVPEESRSPLTSVNRDKGLGRILIAAILIPVLAMAVLAFGLVAYRGTFSTSSIGTVSGMPYEEYLGNRTIAEWLKVSKASADGIYVLEQQVTTKDGTNTDYLIYYKGLSHPMDATAEGLSRNLFKGSTLKISYTSRDGIPADDYHIFQVNYFTADVPALEIYLDGVKANYTLIRTSGSISFSGGIMWKQYAEDLYKAKVQYLGNNSAVSNLIGKTGFAGLGEYSIELETGIEPYGLTVTFNSPIEAFSELDLMPDAMLLLGLIENLDHVEILSGDVDFKLNAAEASDMLGYDVKDIGSSREALLEYLENSGNLAYSN